MKNIKYLFAILFLTTMFMACETDSVNDEIGLEVEINDIDTIGEDDEGQTQPPR